MMGNEGGRGASIEEVRIFNIKIKNQGKGLFKSEIFQLTQKNSIYDFSRNHHIMQKWGVGYP